MCVTADVGKCAGGSEGDNNGNVTRTGGLHHTAPAYVALWSKLRPLSTLMPAGKLLGIVFNFLLGGWNSVVKG